ncbi:MAG TPA: hypothetical protein VE263_12905 [Candidatus Angelobacter sp.]|nr:hypothetical protein [Candidatus Angelobacter sp.]
MALLTAVLLLPTPASAFNTPLSEEAVREAYFLGQRHDGYYPRLLEKYTTFLPPPKNGPYISSIAFYTPFLQIVQYADRYIGNYSAQQAQIDYRGKGDEIVQIFVEIQLTESYGRLMPMSDNTSTSSPPALVPRPHDFWKDFHVRIHDGDQELTPTGVHGYANSNCGRRGPCALTGATLELDFLADAFSSDTATIEVIPPEGTPVSVNFDLSSLR